MSDVPLPPELVPVYEEANALGFDVVGVTSGQPVSDALAALEAWCAAGYQADLAWMARNPVERTTPVTLQRRVGTVISVAVHYAHTAPTMAHDGRYGRVARYAWGRDYHDLMLPRLRTLARSLAARLGGRARAACDHSPILERAFAARAGLGWFGKNTLLLRPAGGSWFLLGEVLLEAELPPSPSRTGASCGTCTSCLDACPTGAFVAPHVLDSRRCISYWTIEHRGALSPEARAGVGDWLFGCDICQEVCPFNRFARGASWPELAPEAGAGPRVALDEVLALRTDAAFETRFANSPLLRPGRAGLLRNAACVARNIGAEAAVPALLACLDDAEALVRGHALWALEGLAHGAARVHAERLLSDSDAFVRQEAQGILDGRTP